MEIDITIRPVEVSDAQTILEIYNPIIENLSTTFEEIPLSVSEMQARIQKVTQAFPWLVAIDSNKQLVGYAYASLHRERSAYRWCTDVSAYIREGYRGQKIGRRLYSELFSILHKQNYHLTYAIITLPNEASIRLHESMGFTPIGVFQKAGFKMGKWHDVGWWQLVLKESTRPAEITPYPALK